MAIQLNVEPLINAAQRLEEGQALCPSVCAQLHFFLAFY